MFYSKVDLGYELKEIIVTILTKFLRIKYTNSHVKMKKTETKTKATTLMQGRKTATFLLDEHVFKDIEAYHV